MRVFVGPSARQIALDSAARSLLRRMTPISETCAIIHSEEIEALRFALASGMSAFGQDPHGLEAKPASPTAEGGDAHTSAPSPDSSS